MSIIEIIGWIGSILLVGSYFLNVNGKLKSTSAAYLICNIIAGVLFTIYTFAHRTYPNMVVNIIWVFIPIAALVKRVK